MVETNHSAQAYVRNTVAEVYAEDSFRSEIVSQVLMGERVHVLDDFGRWIMVRTEDGTEGAVHSGSLTTQDLPDGETYICNVVHAELREEPSEHSLCMAGAVLGARVASNSKKENGHLEVFLPDRRRAFVDRHSFLPESDFRRLHPLEPSSLVRTADSLRGRPYLWGGTSSLALDCSGLTRLVYAIHGVILPRNSSDQGRIGDAGPEDHRKHKRGDLLFFSVDGQGIDHVALSLGSESFLHASASAGGVVVQSLSEHRPDFSPLLQGAFRYCRRLAELWND